MLPYEDNDREVIEKVIAATETGAIQWKSSEADFNQRFYAIWHGWKLTATWFQDETSFAMHKKGVGTFYISCRVMHGLKFAIVTQIDPNWPASERRIELERKEIVVRLARERERTLQEILNLP